MRFVKTISYLLFLISGIVLYTLFHLGITCILTTIYVYVSVYLCASAIIQWIFKRDNRLKENIALLTVALIGSLLIGELILRYWVKAELNYCEINDEFFSFHYPRTQNLDYLARKYIYHEDNQWVKVDKNTSRYHGNKEFNYLHTYNSLGFRDSEPKVDSSEYVIVGLGDSFTEGIGTPQDSTYPLLLQTILNESKTSKYRVLNAGQAGADVYSEYMILKNCFLQYKPRLVILLLNRSDISEIAEKGAMERFLPNGRLACPSQVWWEPIYEISYITRLFVSRVLKYNKNGLNGEEEKKLELDAQNKIVEGIVNYINPVLLSHGSHLLVIYQPMQEDIERSDELINIKRALSRYPEVETLDLSPIIEKDASEGRIILDSIYWPMDKHFNSKGYLYISQIISQKIKAITMEDPHDAHNQHKAINPDL